MATGASAEWIAIGEITAPQGLQGEVRVRPLSDVPERLARLTAVHVRRPGEPPRRLGIRSARPHGRIWVMRLDGVDEREQAEALRGAELCLRRGELEALPAGSYYVFQLIGLDVFDTAGEALGTLEEVLPTGANDVYVVGRPRGKPLLIPAIRECVREVDLERRRMVVSLLPGLDEL